MPVGSLISPSWSHHRFRSHVSGRVVVLQVAGPLSDAVEGLDLATRCALAQDPRGVVCDLSQAVEVGESGALRGIATAGRHVRDWPGVPVAVGGLAPRYGARLRRMPLGDHLVVTDSLPAALTRVMQMSCPTVDSRRLAPHPTAPRAARDFVSRTLLDWGLGHRIPAACLLASELVSNAVLHAQTHLELTVAEHRASLRLAVRDHSRDMPLAGHGRGEARGRGLTLIEGLSSAWGILPAADGGKVVWAALDASPRRSA
jgi:hypothetical protein